MILVGIQTQEHLRPTSNGCRSGENAPSCQEAKNGDISHTTLIDTRKENERNNPRTYARSGRENWLPTLICAAILTHGGRTDRLPPPPLLPVLLLPLFSLFLQVNRLFRLIIPAAIGPCRTPLNNHFGASSSPRRHHGVIVTAFSRPRDGRQLYFRPVNRDLQRLESISRSPIFAQFSETLNGVSTLRAYNQQVGR